LQLVAAVTVGDVVRKRGVGVAVALVLSTVAWAVFGGDAIVVGKLPIAGAAVLRTASLQPGIERSALQSRRYQNRVRSGMAGGGGGVGGPAGRRRGRVSAE
jgi:hypothetical protein